MATHDVADVAAAVAAALADRGGGPWADVRDVRAEVLRRLSLPEDALTSTDVFIALLNAIGVRAPAADVAGATAHHLRALCSASSTPASATASLEELEAALADAGRAREALSPELDLVPVLCGYLLSAEPQLPALALRVLTAASMHGGGCTTLLLQARGLGDSGGLVGALLGRLARSGEDVGILIAALLNNLADTPANQMRLVASGALAALTHVVLDPSASGVIKEHALTAAAAMGGMADEEVSFPQLIGRLCGSRVPGTQREAVRAMAILADRLPLRPQLAAVGDIVAGLRLAVESRDGQAAEGARQVLTLLGVG